MENIYLEFWGEDIEIENAFRRVVFELSEFARIERVSGNLVETEGNYSGSILKLEGNEALTQYFGLLKRESSLAKTITAIREIEPPTDYSHQIEIVYYRQNKKNCKMRVYKETCVKIIHRDSEIEVFCEMHRSKHSNLQEAINLLHSKLVFQSKSKAS